MAVELRNARMDAQPRMLAALLSAACPAAKRCAALHLRVCGLTPAAVQGCSAHLVATTQLVLSDCSSTDVEATMAPDLEALAQQTLLLCESDSAAVRAVSGRQHGPPPVCQPQHWSTPSCGRASASDIA